MRPEKNAFTPASNYPAPGEGVGNRRVSCLHPHPNPLPEGRVNSKAGFTLVEMLVVFGIISILAAMLLPALRQVAEAGRTSACVNNMKQMSLATTVYITENKGTIMPPVPEAYKNTYNSFDEFLVPLAGDDPGILDCPSHKTPKLDRSLYDPRDYAIAGKADRPGGDWTVGAAYTAGNKLANIKAPTTTLLFYEWDTEYINYDRASPATTHPRYKQWDWTWGNYLGYAVSNTWGDLAGIHSGRSNFTYVAGNIKTHERLWSDSAFTIDPSD